MYQVLRFRAKSTVQKYVSHYWKFKTYLQQTGRTVCLPYNSLLIVEYLSYLHEKFLQRRAALFLRFKVGSRPLPYSPPGGNPADTPLSRNIVESSKRFVLNQSTNKSQSHQRFLNVFTTGTPNPIVLDFSGLLRANELLDLTTTDISIKDRHLEIYVRNSKTDQYRG